MPTLFLLRHAKSSWDEPGLADFDRPLAKRGRKAAPLAGAEMARRGWLPDLALVSPAKRARQTWKRAGKALADAAGAKQAPETRFAEALYMAAPEAILALLHAVPDNTGSVVVVGHNPGLEELAILLAGPGSDAMALDGARAKFPTSALARFSFDGAWKDLAPGGAALTGFLRPRELADNA